MQFSSFFDWIFTKKVMKTSTFWQHPPRTFVLFNLFQYQDTDCPAKSSPSNLFTTSKIPTVHAITKCKGRQPKKKSLQSPVFGSHSATGGCVASIDNSGTNHPPGSVHRSTLLKQRLPCRMIKTNHKECLP